MLLSGNCKKHVCLHGTTTSAMKALRGFSQTMRYINRHSDNDILTYSAYVFTEWAVPVIFGNDHDRRTETSCVVARVTAITQQNLHTHKKQQLCGKHVCTVIKTYPDCVKKMDFLYILFFSATANTPNFANVYIFEVRLKSLETPLKHYNFSQKHFQTLFRTKFLLCKVNRKN